MNANQTTQQPSDMEIIQRLGGTTKTADLCEVSAQAVSQWCHNGIPKARRMFLRAVRPEVFAADWRPPESQPKGENDSSTEQQH